MRRSQLIEDIVIHQLITLDLPIISPLRIIRQATRGSSPTQSFPAKQIIVL